MRRHLRCPSAARVSLILGLGRVALRSQRMAHPIYNGERRGREGLAGSADNVQHHVRSTYSRYVVYWTLQRRRAGRTNRGEGPKVATKSPDTLRGRVRGGDDSEGSKVEVLAGGGPHLTVGTDGGMGSWSAGAVRRKLVRMYCTVVVAFHSSYRVEQRTDPQGFRAED